MSDEQAEVAGTKPEQEVETKPDTAVETTAAPSGDTETTQEQTTITRDQYEAAVREMNERQREAARYAQERDYYQRIAQEATGAVQRATDPEAAAAAKYRKALEDNPYDTAAILAAKDELDEARFAKRSQALIQQALSAARVQNEMPEVARLLKVTDQQQLANRLLGVQQSLTPKELAMVDLLRQGKLPDHITSERKRQEEEAKRAELIRSLAAGGPAGRRVPGSLDGAARKEIDFVDWASLNESAKKRIRESGDEVVITNAPKHFDPNTE